MLNLYSKTAKAEAVVIYTILAVANGAWQNNSVRCLNTTQVGANDHAAAASPQPVNKTKSVCNRTKNSETELHGPAPFLIATWGREANMMLCGGVIAVMT